jgi:hypothetical protein
VIFWVSVAAAIVVGWIRGGALGALAEVRVRWWGVPLAGAGVHLLLRLWHGLAPLRGLEMGASIALYVALGAFLALNRALPGALLALVGIAANFAATLWGGGRMPVWTATLARLSATRVHLLLAGRLASHVAMPRPAGLGWLGDIFAVPPPLRPDVVSPGDLFLAAGLAVFVALSMAPRRRPAA